MQVNPQVNDLFIISAHKKGNSERGNDYNTDLLNKELRERKIKYSEVEGQFDGVQEVAFVLSDTNMLKARAIALKFMQECILHLVPYRDNMFKAYFVDALTGDSAFQGYFRSVSKEEIDSLGLDYTRDASGQYFTIWPTDTLNMHDLNLEIIARKAVKS